MELTRNRTRKVAAGLLFTASLFGADPSTEGRIVTVGKSDIVPVATHLRYSTLIELPEDEHVIGIDCGDKVNWDIQEFNTRNFVFVRPKGDKPGRDTNLYLYTEAGNLYGFIIREVSSDPKTKSDLKVVVQQGDEYAKAAMQDVHNSLGAQVAALTEEVNLLQHERPGTKPAKPEEQPVRDYKWPHDRTAERFGIRDIWHDSRSTFIKAETQDAPALYERTDDGRDALVQYTLANGIYTVNKVLDSGYLRLGRNKLEFKREKS